MTQFLRPLIQHLFSSEFRLVRMHHTKRCLTSRILLYIWTTFFTMTFGMIYERIWRKFILFIFKNKPRSSSDFIPPLSFNIQTLTTDMESKSERERNINFCLLTREYIYFSSDSRRIRRQQSIYGFPFPVKQTSINSPISYIDR